MTSHSAANLRNWSDVFIMEPSALRKPRALSLLLLGRHPFPTPLPARANKPEVEATDSKRVLGLGFFFVAKPHHFLWPQVSASLGPLLLNAHSTGSASIETNNALFLFFAFQKSIGEFLFSRVSHFHRLLPRSWWRTIRMGSRRPSHHSTRFALAHLRAETGGRRGSRQRKTSRRPSKLLCRRFVED